VARIVAMPPDLSANAVVRTLDVALVVGASVSGVVLWGATMGAMLPLVLHRAGFDPASASAPFVATLVDVTGLIIYFSVATAILSGGLG
jgi:magnesium transporter